LSNWFARMGVDERGHCLQQGKAGEHQEADEPVRQGGDPVKKKGDCAIATCGDAAYPARLSLSPA